MQQIRCTQLKQSHEPNGYNLYNMAGMFQNGQTLLTTLMHEYVSSMNPNVLDASNKRKVVRVVLERRCLLRKY
jgi:hypothetical protein